MYFAFTLQICKRTLLIVKNYQLGLAVSDLSFFETVNVQNAQLKIIWPKGNQTRVECNYIYLENLVTY